eukprot:Skav226526  [mRNA]  locus=scaffold1773:233177:242669:- [translate_table: standard]
MPKPVPGLKELLRAASLDSYIPQAELWCDQAGAVDLSEILDVEESFADALGLKLLERRRLRKCAVNAGTARAPQCHGEVDLSASLAEPDSEPASLQAKESGRLDSGEREEQAERALNKERHLGTRKLFVDACRLSNSALVTWLRQAREMERNEGGNVMCGFVFDTPLGPSEPPRRLVLASGPNVNFTWAATWWGIRVNQVKKASVGLRLDDFIVEVAGALHIAAENRLPLVCLGWMSPCVCKDSEVTRLPPSPVPEGFAAPDFPFITLLVSGGHNMAVLTRGVGQHIILGSTIDDSIGEAFDKTVTLVEKELPSAKASSLSEDAKKHTERVPFKGAFESCSKWQ